MAETPFNSADFAGTRSIRDWQRTLNALESFYGDEAQLKIADTYAVGITGRVPVNSVAPAITGTLNVGDTLTVTNGTWSPVPTSYARQWYADDVAISGATGLTHVLAAEQDTAMITVIVTATLNNMSATQVSNEVGPVTNV